MEGNTIFSIKIDILFHLPIGSKSEGFTGGRAHEIYILYIIVQHINVVKDGGGAP